MLSFIRVSRLGGRGPHYSVRTYQQSVVKVPRRTETGDAPVRQGATKENTGSIRPRSNAASRDAAPVECSGTFTTGCQSMGLHSVSAAGRCWRRCGRGRGPALFPWLRSAARSRCASPCGRLSRRTWYALPWRVPLVCGSVTSRWDPAMYQVATPILSRAPCTHDDATIVSRSLRLGWFDGLQHLGPTPSVNVFEELIQPVPFAQAGPSSSWR